MNEMAKTDKVLSRKEGGVGYVVFNNPARHNAMSLDMWAETGRIMEEFAKDDALRCVVLTGAGEKAFVSGADISRMALTLVNEQADDVVATLYSDYCRLAGGPARKTN